MNLAGHLGIDHGACLARSLLLITARGKRALIVSYSLLCSKDRTRMCHGKAVNR